MIINLTPHTLNLPGMTIASSGVARCATVSVSAGSVEDMGVVVPLYRTTYGEVVGLPGPVEGTLYVVSALVRSAVPNRTDVASPGELVRDSSGVVIGCSGLVVN
jgi:hypothetical protein